MNLAKNLTHHARSRAFHPAIIEGGRIVTYGELDGLVDRTAAHLAGLGVGDGDIVGVCLADHVDHLLVLYALARLGSAILPMEWRWNVAEQERVAGFFGTKLVVAEPSADPLKAVSSVPVDAAWQAAVAAAAALPADKRPDRPNLPLVLSLSSGTSGRPKGPLITHENMEARFRGHWVSLGFCQHDRFMVATPLFYGGARGFSMSYLYCGGTVVLFPPPFKPHELAAAVKRHRISTMMLVPTQIRRLLEIAPARGRLLPGLRRLLSSGSALFAEERQAIRQKITRYFFDYYSSTEGGGITLLTPEDQEICPDSVGRPAYLVDVEVVDESHAPVPTGQVGRIRYRGPGVAPGFYKETGGEGAFFRDGWFYPGDLGCHDEDGYLFLRGRAKDMIIRGGVNIYPTDVEQVLQTHEAVQDAVVVGWPSPEFGEELAAFVVPRQPLEEGALLEFCRASLAPYKVPRAVFFVDDLPKNPTGKVLKQALAERLPKLT